MKSLIVTTLLLLCGTVCAQPVIGNNTAAALVSRALEAEPLLWLPFPMPYEIERNRQDKDAGLLDGLFRFGLLRRDSEMKMTDVEENGRRKRKVVAVWIYDYPLAHREQGTQEGFYYGTGKLKNILEVSSPYRIGEYYYAEVYIQWYVDDLQEWVKDPAFRSARTLRRSLESFRKPFEKRVYLQHDGQSWGFWSGQPGVL
ncbi:MAG: hypothetical protein LRY66_06695 [Saccharospirillaceae bacterium]|nr:hypothetical protein [Saccharospirillaceae bacterium]MCD8531040.1 hypothetical protein [Saccharospirillaceae bacterium]